MWGLVMQNAGFIWWNRHERTTLPLTLRLGNTWRIRPGALTTIEYETRYYNEGSNKEDYLHLGGEMELSEFVSIRAGIFGDQLDEPEDRHYTAGLSIKTQGDAEVSYAAEQFEIDNEKVIKSYISVSFPFAADEDSK